MFYAASHVPKACAHVLLGMDVQVATTANLSTVTFEVAEVELKSKLLCWPSKATLARLA